MWLFKQNYKPSQINEVGEAISYYSRKLWHIILEHFDRVIKKRDYAIILTENTTVSHVNYKEINFIQGNYYGKVWNIMTRTESRSGSVTITK